MPDVATLVKDLSRLHAELASGRAQLAKLKAKGAKDKAREAAKAVEESQDFYDAILEQLPPEIADNALEHIESLRKAQAAVDKAEARLRGLAPSVPDITVASAVGGAHDATVSIKES